jgi:BirA family biotin operon repressor/biotin-[acetyl-CoA-carboxylase] ligase
MPDFLTRRAAVCYNRYIKNIKNEREIGMKGVECTAYGLSAEKIRAHLKNTALPILLFDEISSTSDAAREYARENPLEAAVFIAEKQTAGRGRRGRSFSSPAGSGVYMSLLVYPTHAASDGVLLTTGAAVAMCRAVEDAASLSPEIKWVNDLKLGGKKLCGILTEGEIDPESGAFAYAVIGAGINVRGVPPEVADIATALDLHTDGPTDRNLLCAKMIARILESLTEDRAAQMREYRRRCPVAGKEITVLRGDERYFATVLSIEEDGSLRILRKGEQQLLSSGEISIRE